MSTELENTQNLPLSEKLLEILNHDLSYDDELVSSLPKSSKELFVDSWLNQVKEKPISFIEFLNEHFQLSPDATVGDGQFEAYHWQLGVACFYSNLDIREVHCMKPAQCGMTQILKALCGYEVACRRRTVAAIQPDQGFAKWFSNLQIKTLIRDVKIVGDQLRGDPDKANDSDNTSRLRIFKNGAIYCRGATTDKELKGFSVDTIGCDEIDASEPDIDGQGTMDGLASLRTKESPKPKQINQSSPSVEGESRIDTLVKSIRPYHQFHYYVRCSCGTRQQLVWGGDDTTHGIQWSKVYENPEAPESELVLDLFETSRTAVYRCCNDKCNREYKHAELPELDQTGRWQSTEYWLDHTTELFHSLEDDSLQPPPYKAAVIITGLLGYVLSWETAVYDFLEAVQASRRGDPSKLIKFQNGYLGQVSIPLRNDDLATWEELQSRAKPIDECPDWVQYIDAGVDIGKDHIVYEIVGWGEHFESVSLERRRIDCRPLTDTSVHDTLQTVRKQTFEMRDGTEMPVKLVMCDSRFARAKVLEACAKNPAQLIPIQGTGSMAAPPVKLMNKPHKDHKVFICTVGTQTVGDTIGELLAIKLPGDAKRHPGYAHFPDTPWHDEAFYKELCGEILKTKYTNNRPVTKWDKRTKDTRVESLDARRYAYCGVKLAELRYNFRFMSDVKYVALQNNPQGNDKGPTTLSDIADGWNN